ncbi:hypothetical protein D083_1662 [Dickeya solani RNS 08.23.3.1.A]|nr:hypothetical protein D083_1662 [Dickeya solani RNS 08.23.3.1.A]
MAACSGGVFIANVGVVYGMVNPLTGSCAAVRALSWAQLWRRRE